MSFKHTIIASLIMVLTLVCVGYVSQSEEIQPNRPFSQFPARIGEWVGQEEQMDPRIREAVGVDEL